MKELWSLPPGWRWAEFSEVARVDSNLVDPAHHAELPHIAPNHIESGTGRLLEFTTVAKDGVTSGKHHFRAGHILYSKIRPYLAKTVIVDFDGLCSADMYPVSTDLEPRFLHRWLVSPMFTEQAARNQGRTVLPKINRAALARLPVPVAPQNEQRRIVAKLEALQARSRCTREALEAVPPLLEKLRQSILAAAFRGDLTKDWREKHPDVEPASELLKRIRIERRKKWEEGELAKMKAKGKTPTDDRWKAKYVESKGVDAAGLPALPRGWCWAAWREVGFCQNGRAFPSSEYSDGGVKLLRPGNLHVSGVLVWTSDNTRFMPKKWADEYPDFLVHENELVMNLTAQSLKDEFLGRVCLSSECEASLLNQRIGRLTPVIMGTRYWLLFFKSPGFRRYVDTLNTGSLIQHMFTSQLDECVVPLMPLEEARVLIDEIDERLARVLSALRLVVDQSERLPSLERSILAKAFRGELVPQDANDEPPGVMLARARASDGSHEKKTDGRKRSA